MDSRLDTASVVSFDDRYDFDTNKLLPAQEVDERLLPLRQQVANWANVTPESLVHALVAEHASGTPPGRHRDVPN